MLFDIESQTPGGKYYGFTGVFTLLLSTLHFVVSKLKVSLLNSKC